MLLLALRKGMFAIPVDIKDAALHVPIRVGRRPCLRLFYQGAHYQWNVHPFSRNASPRLFAKLFRMVAAHFRQRDSLSCVH
jgi:hypothetical protein